MKIIFALIKKEFTFNWKISIGCLVVLLFFMIGAWMEFQYTGILDMDGFLLAFLIAAFGFMPINYSLRQEQSPSTKQFLNSLPINCKDILFSKVLVATLYSGMIAMLLWGLSCILKFDLSVYYVLFGLASSICFSAIYTLINYWKNFNIAQLLFFAVFGIWYVLGRYKGAYINTLQFFTNSWSFYFAILLLICLSICCVLILIKLKRRL